MGPPPAQKPLINIRENIKQGPNPLPVSGHSPETLQLPSRQPTMAWVLAQHSFDGVLQMNTVSMSKNTKHSYTLDHSTTVTFPFSTHRSAGYTGKKNSPTMRQHSLQ